MEPPSEKSLEQTNVETEFDIPPQTWREICRYRAHFDKWVEVTRRRYHNKLLLEFTTPDFKYRLRTSIGNLRGGSEYGSLAKPVFTSAASKAPAGTNSWDDSDYGKTLAAMPIKVLEQWVAIRKKLEDWAEGKGDFPDSPEKE